MVDNPDEDFVRAWSERAYDHAQLAAIKEIEDHLIAYAMTAWREMSITPPANRILLCSCEEGLVLMVKNHIGDWRTSQGQPHKPPLAWMPAPTPHVHERQLRAVS